jgi:hypothetical protein
MLILGSAVERRGWGGGGAKERASQQARHISERAREQKVRAQRREHTKS